MKTKKSLLTMMVVLIVAIGFATEKVKLNVVPLDSDKALVAVNAESPTSFEVIIKNQDNETVYYSQSKKENHRLRTQFDFSELKHGSYRITVNCKETSLNGAFELNDKGVKVEELINSVPPCITQEGDKLNIAFLNYPQKQVYYNIYKDGEHVSGGKLGKEFTIQKRMDLSGLEAGEYELMLSDEYNDHTYMVSR